MTVHGRNGHHLVKAEVVELVQLHGSFAHLVALVHGKNDGLVAAAQHMRHVLVGCGQAVAHVRDHDDAVGGVNGDLCLLAHMGKNALGGLGLDAAGVHQQKLVAVPLAVGKNAVAGNARGILHDGQALAAEFVEQGRLAHVGAAHHRYDRFAHVVPPFLLLEICRPLRSRALASSPPDVGSTSTLTPIR